MGAYCGEPLIGYRDWHEPDEAGAAFCHGAYQDKIDLLELALVSEAEPEKTIEEVEGRFAILAETWRNETRNISNMTEVFSHYAYRRVIDLGPRVIPVILRELERQPDLWFFALRKITGANPVRKEYAGNMKKIRDAWLRWGRQNKKL